ncbi:MAG: (Fe-S)-binding protein [Acidimicrobiia bacterium]|nr:(Fe-S)-binding protein [Acidimicrobiia bacterium]
MATQLFVTCLVDAFYPEVGEATVAVLERAGDTVAFPVDQTCCGQPAFNVGMRDEARAMAVHTLSVLDATEGPIVVPSGSCADMIVHHYADLFEDDPESAGRAARVAGRVRELTQYLVDDKGRSDLGTACDGCTATYHPSCHGLRNLGIRAQPEALLDATPGMTRVDLPDAENCCGFGGLFAVEMPDVSVAMMETKIANIEKSGADMLVGVDVSCLMHLAGGLHRRGSPIRVRHIAQILAGAPDDD